MKKTEKTPRWVGIIQLGCILFLAGLAFLAFGDLRLVKYAVTILVFVFLLFFLLRPSDKAHDSEVAAAKRRLDNAITESERVEARIALERLLK